MSPDACLTALVLNQFKFAASAQKAAELEIAIVWGSCCLLLQQWHGTNVLHPQSALAELKGSHGM